MDWSADGAPSAVSRSGNEFEDWGLYYENSSNDIVKGQFDAGKDLANQLISETKSMLSQLTVSVIGGADINYTAVTEPVLPESSLSVPEAPAGTLVLSAQPVFQGSIENISMNLPAVPVDNTGAAPSGSYSFTETPFTSDLLNELRNRIQSVVVNGGEAVADSVQQSILANALAADTEQHDANYNEALNFYAAKGLSPPPGALVARINMLNRNRARAQEIIVSNFTNKMAELAHNHGQFMVGQGVTLTATLIEQHDKIQARALEYAKQVVLIPIEVYRIRMQAWTNAVEAYKAQVSAEGVKVDAITKKNLSIVEVYKGQVQAYDAIARAESAVLESAAKIYTAQIAGYEAQVKAESQNNALLIEKFKAMVQQAGFELQADSKSAELYAQQVIAEAQRNAAASGDAAKAMAQIAATALSSLNVSATIGFTQTETTSDQRQIAKEDRSSNASAYQESKSLS